MKFALAAALAAVATAAAGPAPAQGVPVRLADGATWTITAEHTRSDGTGTPMHNWSVTTVKRLTWHGGKRPTLTINPVSATPGPSSPSEIAQARSLAVPATLRVDANLAPGEIVNLDEVMAAFLRVAPSAAGGDPAVAYASSKAMIASEVGLMARVQGLPLKEGVPIARETALPNPLGGPPFRGVERAQLDSIDQAAGVAKISWSQSIDPDSFRASIKAMLDSLAKQALSPEKLAHARATLEKAAYDNHTDCRYEVATDTGLARHAECRMTLALTAAGESERVVETWTITQTSPDKT